MFIKAKRFLKLEYYLWRKKSKINRKFEPRMLWNQWLLQFYYKYKLSIHDLIWSGWIIIEYDHRLRTAAYWFDLIESSSMFQDAVSFLIDKIYWYIQHILAGEERSLWAYWNSDTYFFVFNGCKEIHSSYWKFKESLSIIV